MPTRLELGVDPFLDDAEAKLLELRDGRLREWVVRELGEGRPPPERLGLPQQGSARRCVQPARLFDESSRASRVDVVLLKTQDVARRLRQETIGPEQFAQTRDRVLERRRRGAWRLLPPEGVDHPISRDHLVEVQEEKSEQGALVAAAKWQPGSIVDDLEWTEDPELHSEVVTPCLPFWIEAC